MAWLVAMGILPNHSSHIGWHIRWHLRALVEQLIELLDKGLLATKCLDQKRRIMLHAEGSLPGVRLRVVSPLCNLDRLGIERRGPSAIRKLRSNKPCFLVVQIHKRARPFHQQRIVCLLSSCLGQRSHSPVVIRIIERFARRLILYIARNVAELPISSQTAIVIHLSPLLERSVGSFRINSAKALRQRLSDNGSRVVAYHAPRLAPLQRPHRHTLRALLGHAD